MSDDPERPYHHGDLRSALLSVAVDVINEEGVPGLSLRACARRIGVSHAAPYRHFPSKAALLAAIAGEGFRWLVAAAEVAMAQEDDDRGRLDAYGVAYVQFAVDHPVHHRVMFATQFDLSAFDPEDKAVADQAFALLRTCAVGLPGADEDPDGAAFAYWSLVHGMSMLLLDGRVPPERLAGLDAVERLTRAAFATWRRQAV
jgi:AcrR family transcriptional regulator